ncbi:MAG: YeeE/YedE family protein [Bdellovibrionales bacterium]|nr:YeeE/YedE family protein [Bdellovibrionales bacterium]
MSASEKSPAATDKINKEMILAGLILVMFSVVISYLASGHQSLLFLTGIALGFVLYYAHFGFTGSFASMLQNGATAGFRAILFMLGLAAILFFPVLDSGNLFGGAVVGNIAPAGISVIIGSFLFGIGMQLGGSCSCGTLIHLGEGSARMAITLVFMILGALLGIAHLDFWHSLPALPPISLIDTFGWFPALVGTIVALGIIWIWVGDFEKRQHRGPISTIGFRSDKPLRDRLLAGYWPLAYGAIALALLNFLTLYLAGRPWGVVSGYSLWGGKLFYALGLGVEQWQSWATPERQLALQESIFTDITSVMNMGIILGALLTAGAAQKFSITWKVPRHLILSSMVGGGLMGYGAHLAYGCNIGAFFSGIASGSLHGWFWIIFALAGSYIGIHLRPLFLFGQEAKNRSKIIRSSKIPFSPKALKAILAMVLIAVFTFEVLDNLGQLDFQTEFQNDAQPEMARPTNHNFDMSGFGAYLVSIDPHIAGRYNLPIKSGVLVNNIEVGSYAESIGLIAGDIITQFNGKNVYNRTDIARGFAKSIDGDRINLKILRHKRRSKNIKFTYKKFTLGSQINRVGIMVTSKASNPTIANTLIDARYMQIYTLDTGKLSILKNPFQGMTNGEVAGWILDKRIGNVIVGHIDQGDRAQLMRKGVRIYSGVFGSSSDALALYRQGALVAKHPMHVIDYQSINFIAMPSDYTYPGAPIAANLEVAQFIVRLELDRNQYEVFNNPIYGQSEGGSVLLAQFLSENMIDLIITNRVSSSIMVELQKTGVQVKTGVDTSIESAVLQFHNGTL